MRRRQRIIASTLGVSLLAAACSDAGGIEQPAVPTSVAAPAEDDGDGPDLDPTDLLREYGELLVAAATVGGDALERTLTMTADDRERFDADCAPNWAHGLLDAAGTDAPLPVRTDGSDLTIGAIAVPVSVQPTRVAHRTEASCDGRLPQPDRPPRLAAAKASTAPAPSPAPSAPPAAPAPAPPPPAAPAPPQPAPSPTPAPSPKPTPTPPVTLAEYDEELATWSEGFHEIFEIIVEGQTFFGPVGGGSEVADVYASLGDAIEFSSFFWASVDPPAGREEPHEALLAGLEVWTEEIRLLSACATDPDLEECPEIWTLRAAWQEHFATVTEATGVPLPAGHLEPPDEAEETGSPPRLGQFNLGEIRVPTEFEVRRQLN
jgi:hypothetical protein